MALLTAHLSRGQSLFDALPSSLDKLRRRLCSEIPSGYIEDYVALNWLEWHGGGLRVTTTGENMCKQALRTS